MHTHVVDFAGVEYATGEEAISEQIGGSALGTIDLLVSHSERHWYTRDESDEPLVRRDADTDVPVLVVARRHKGPFDKNQIAA